MHLWGRQLFHHDVDDIGGTTAVADPSVEAGGDPAGDAAPALPAADPAAPPAWAPSRDEWEEQQAELAQLRQFLLSQQQQPDPGDPLGSGDQGRVVIDPFSDDFGDQLAGFLGQFLDQRLAPLHQRLEPIVHGYQTQAAQEAEARVTDVITDYAASQGIEFLEGGDAAARQLAEALLPDYRARFGPGQRAAEAALHKAVDTIADLQRRAEQRGEQRFKNQLGDVTGALAEPGSAGTGVRTVPDARDETDLVDRWFGMAR